MHALTEAAVLLIHAVFGAALFIAVLRVLLQLVSGFRAGPVVEHILLQQHSTIVQ